MPSASPTGGSSRRKRDYDDEDDHGTIKMVAIFGGILTFIAVVAIVVATWPDKKPTDVAKNEEPTPPVAPVDPADLESNPGGDDGPGPADADSANDSGSLSAGDAISTRAQQAARKVRRWAKSGLMLRDVATVKVVAAWVEPATGDKKAQLRMQVELKNVSQNQALQFSSWTGAGPVGEDARALILLPDSEAGGLALDNAASGLEQPGSISLAPGDTHHETLAFVAPMELPDSVKLMLPKQAIGRDTEPFGFELSKVKFTAGTRPADPASAAIGGIQPAADSSPPDQPAAGESDAAGDGAAANRPPTIEELNRQIKAAREREKMEEAKKADDK